MARLAKSAAESLSVYLCNSVQSLSRASAENETEIERERDQRENQRVNESERERIPESLETSCTFLQDKSQKLLYKKSVDSSSTGIKWHSLSKHD